MVAMTLAFSQEVDGVDNTDHLNGNLQSYMSLVPFPDDCAVTGKSENSSPTHGLETGVRLRVSTKKQPVFIQHMNSRTV